MRQEKLTNLVEDTRTTLREAKIEFTGLGIVNGEVLVRITDPAKVPDAANALRNTVGSALAGAAGGRDVTVGDGPGPADPYRLRQPGARRRGRPRRWSSPSRSSAAGSTNWAPGSRTSAPGHPAGSWSQAPGESDPQQLRAIIGQTAKLTFQMVDETADR